MTLKHVLRYYRLDFGEYSSETITLAFELLLQKLQNHRFEKKSDSGILKALGSNEIRSKYNQNEAFLEIAFDF